MEVQGFSLLVNTRTYVLRNHVKLFHILNQKVMPRQKLIAALVCVFDNWKGVHFLNLNILHPKCITILAILARCIKFTTSKLVISH